MIIMFVVLLFVGVGYAKQSVHYVNENSFIYVYDFTRNSSVNHLHFDVWRNDNDLSSGWVNQLSDKGLYIYTPELTAYGFVLQKQMKFPVTIFLEFEPTANFKEVWNF